MGFAIILGFLAIILILVSMVGVYYVGVDFIKAKELESQREKVLIDAYYIQHNRINITNITVFPTFLCRNYTIQVKALNRGSEVIDKSKLLIFERNMIINHNLSSGWKPYETITFNITGINSYVGEQRLVRIVTDYGGIAVKHYNCTGNCSFNTTFSNWHYNSTGAGTNINFSINVSDSDYIKSIIFAFDNGVGEYTNDTYVVFENNPALYGTGIVNYTFSKVKQINSTVGSFIRFRVYVNDSCGNQTIKDGNLTTSYYCVHSTNIPTFDYSGTNSNTYVTLNTTVTDNDYISGFQFYLDNGTGTFIEYPYEPLNPMQLNYNYQRVILTNPNQGVQIRYYLKVNDSCGNIATGNINGFITT
ncbi:MAG: hypothetical protein N3E37_02385 [Candidatus Micrarchaeota archaeon]|nr:hypothetical protein [Candidatus Micrarchaeota archaeon]